MWELIRSNKRKTWLLFIGMGMLLLATGYILGEVYLPQGGGFTGLFLALMIWAFWSLIGYFKGDSMLLALSRAKEVSHNIHPQLFNVVEEMKIAANLPVLPKIYIIAEDAPNAFATGRKPEKSAIAVTAGLLNQLNRTELQGVIAHEMSHILNRDILYMTYAGIMLGSIVLISEVFLRSLWFSGSSSRRFSSRRSDKGGGGAIAMVAIVLAILAPILSRIFYFTISRKREYLADASAARLSRYPEGLASALEKISSTRLSFSRANSITAPMFIINPLKKQRSSLTGLFSTHPPVQERIKILQNMSRGVNFVNYQSAYQLVTGKGIMPASGLKDSETRPIRKPTGEVSEPASSPTKKRELGDLMRVMNGFVFLICLCGLKLKLPSGFKQSSITCPRCKRSIRTPLAEMAALSGVAAAGSLSARKKRKAMQDAPVTESQKKPETIPYQRRSSGWETMNCTCGNPIQLSPALLETTIHCNQCGRGIKIRRS
ncbi:MAG: M48 family metallopeptidase [Candidatus Aminicenantes bacterium]|nr:M48 family metallopeptidase [Candidatus Aminicenantes bacterium]